MISLVTQSKGLQSNSKTQFTAQGLHRLDSAESHVDIISLVTENQSSSSSNSRDSHSFCEKKVNIEDKAEGTSEGTSTSSRYSREGGRGNSTSSSTQIKMAKPRVIELLDSKGLMFKEAVEDEEDVEPFKWHLMALHKYAKITIKNQSMP